MIHNVAQYVVRIESYVREACSLRSVPPEVLREELECVRERIGELISEIDSGEPSGGPQPHQVGEASCAVRSHDVRRFDSFPR